MPAKTSPASSWYARTVFPALMDVALSGMDEWRRPVVGQARGRTLEIGIGTGLNVPLYPPTLTALTALTPDPDVEARAARRFKDAPFPIDVVHAGAEAMPFPDSSFDTVVGTLVFCTIPDARAAAAEVRRVLKPDGVFRFLEHVRSPRPGVARWQRRLDPLWTRAFCGCHLDRDTAAIFRAAGLVTRDLTALMLPGLPITRDFILGTATRQ